MDINTVVRLSDGEQERLCAVLGCSLEQLPERTSRLGRAALREYVDMLLGENPLRNIENRERRLLLIMLETGDGVVTNEANVARMFNITTASARALIRSVLSRYRQPLTEATEAAAKQVLAQCGEQDEEGFRYVSVTNPILIEYLNERLAAADGTLRRIRLKAGTGTQYAIHGNSFNKLSELLPWE